MENTLQIPYDKKRTDITFCTMLFKIPDEDRFGGLKHTDRKFEKFYLPSLKQLIQTFERVALWCDRETAEYLRAAGLDKNIMMRVMDFADLPHMAERAEMAKIMSGMSRYRGYLLHNKTPMDWVDYMMIIDAKPAVIKWAAENNKFNSDYFMWIDGGGLNSLYVNFWRDWTGTVDAHPTRCRLAVQNTMAKTRPDFVPNFIYRPFERAHRRRIMPATATTLAAQSLTDIAMINADYDVPATSFMIPRNLAEQFYTDFERVRLVMKKHGLVSTEQAVFQAMMKFDVSSMFEIVYVSGYAGVYAAIARSTPDCIL